MSSDLGVKLRDDSADGITYLTTTTSDLSPWKTMNYVWTLNDSGLTLSTKKEKAELPERVIFSDPATILIWKNGDKTVVKTSKGDKYNPLFGFLMAYFKYTSGLNSSKRDKYFKKILEENNGK